MSRAAKGARFSADDGPARPHAAPTRAIGNPRAMPGHPDRRHIKATRLEQEPGDLPERPVPALQRFGLAALEVAGAGLAFAAFWLIWSSVGRTVPAMQAVAWFAALGGAALLAAAVARLLRRRLPTIRPARIDGEPGAGVRAWPGEYWLEIVIDSALALLCVGVLIADLFSGAHWLPWSLLLLIPAAWFGGLSVLAFTGRRNPEAVWVIDDAIVHEALWGRERAHVARCRSLTASGSIVVLTFAEPIDRTLCPRPWRPAVAPPAELHVDCRQLGRSSDDVLAWLKLLSAELGT